MTYVVHFGVKGMHWGVRKNRSGTSMPKKTKTAAQIASRRARNRRIALAGAALIVASPEVMRHTTDFIRTVAGAKIEQNGRRETARIFSDSNGIPSFQSVDLTFNGNTNRWE